MTDNIKRSTRRDFLSQTGVVAAGLAAIGIGGINISAEILKKDSIHPVHIFTKCLQFLSYDEMAEVLAGLGFDGADLTVRSGGQVLPENVETDLPKVLKALRNAGVDSNMIVTNINNANDPMTRPILKTMAKLGIKYYRMGYLNYNASKTIPENLEEYKFTFENLEKLNREFGVHGGYQNHSGRRVGGPVWDLYHLLRYRDPEYIGVQYDIRHATVEGGVSWPLGMNLLAPWIRTIDIKDFVWKKNENGEWKLENVPLGHGMVGFGEFFKLYSDLKIEGPFSIHYEYDLGGAERGRDDPEMHPDKIYSFLKKDLNFFKGQIEKYNL